MKTKVTIRLEFYKEKEVEVPEEFVKGDGTVLKEWDSGFYEWVGNEADKILADDGGFDWDSTHVSNDKEGEITDW